MFETSRPNAAAIALYRAAVDRPLANSLTTDLYRLIPNSTDVTVFAERPWTILNFAIIGTPVEGVVLGLSKVDGPPHTDGVTLTWGVTDIEAAEAALKAAGAQPDGPIRDIPGVVRLLPFSDPDGNKHQFWAPPK